MGNSSETVKMMPGPDTGGFDGALWTGVSRLLQQSSSLDDARSHRLEMLAAASSRELGHQISTNLATQARAAAMKALAAPLVLQRVREVCDGPIVLLKGPETAAYYPNPALRPFNDLDVLVPDAEHMQQALIRAGFKPVGDEGCYVGGHQMAPLRHADYPLLVEVHIRPHWVEGIPYPPIDEFFAIAVPSIVPVPGVMALPRVPHAVLLAVHAWAHEPLGTLHQLIDIAAAREGICASDADAIATSWGVERIWWTTTAAIDALFFAGRRPWPLRVWARNLANIRERSVLETHLQRWLAGFSAFPPSHAARMMVRAVGDDLRPMGGEDWPTKLGRTRTAIRNAFVRRSQHETEVEGASGTRSGRCASSEEERVCTM
jgi:putative nucleotidyltransferase-like protein